MPGARWTEQELAILREYFEREGRDGCAKRLPGREPLAIAQRARKLGLIDQTLGPPAALRAPLGGHDLNRALAMHENGWSYAAIAREFGVSESSATNAILIGRCQRAGYKPARRDKYGHLLAEEIERIRAMLRAGLRGTEIQLRMGISACAVSKQRRDYAADLKARGKKPLPPPGGGEAYSGVRVSAEKRKAAEAAYLEGYGAALISAQTGISRTTILRIRRKLVRKLARQGACLPGCDIKGRRLTIVHSAHFVADDQRADLRRRLLAREPVQRAARAAGVGSSFAYKFRDQLARELADRGERLLPPIRTGRVVSGSVKRDTDWLPKGQLHRYRALVHQFGVERAKAMIIEEAEQTRRVQAEADAAARSRKLTFEEQLERVRQGAKLISVPVIRRAAPDMTLGGNALASII